MATINWLISLVVTFFVCGGMAVLLFLLPRRPENGDVRAMIAGLCAPLLTIGPGLAAGLIANIPDEFFYAVYAVTHLMVSFPTAFLLTRWLERRLQLVSQDPHT